MSIHTILHDLDLGVSHYEAVHGGDINSAYCLHGAGNKFFLKLNDATRYPAMFEKEARGLEALGNAVKDPANTGTLFVPGVKKYGKIDGRQYLVLEWISPGKQSKDFWKNFGRSLARLHQQTSNSFGWEEDNYIGSLVQKNTKHDSWHSFYTECRIMPLVKTLYNSGAFSTNDVKNAESLCRHFRDIFPHRAPAMLHGDLWSGNFMVGADGNAAIYDPAVYYGHHEMDIGMTKLFGGFNEQFYHAYAETYPLEKHWEQRLNFTQLYPLLVHAVLFGGHYTSSARNVIRQF